MTNVPSYREVQKIDISKVRAYDLTAAPDY